MKRAGQQTICRQTAAAGHAGALIAVVDRLVARGAHGIGMLQYWHRRGRGLHIVSARESSNDARQQNRTKHESMRCVVPD